MPAVIRPPGPRGTLIAGNLAELRRDVLGFWRRCAREHGDIVYTRYFHQHHYMLNEPAFIEQVLVKESRSFIKWRPFRALHPLFGTGLALSEGDYWRRQRRLAQPAFHLQRLPRYGAAMVAHTERMLEGWRVGETRQIQRDMARLTLEVAGETLFGADISGRARQAITQAAGLQQMFEAWLTSRLPLPWTVPTPGNLRMRRRVRQLDAILYGLIAERRALPRETDDLLSMLLQARDDHGRGMTDRQLKDELMTLFLASYETTSLTLSWAWYLLAEHPHVETRFREECWRAVGQRSPTVADVVRLPFTEAVIKETLRLYPPVFAQGREALRECTLGGYRVPPGTQVFMSQWIVQRDPRFFPQPDAFRPERWLDGTAARLPRFAYFPFGGGPRVCLGAAFAMMEAVLVMATIGRRFRLVSLPGCVVTPRVALTLQPSRELSMVVRAGEPAGLDE
jgi:cytochrome P450